GTSEIVDVHYRKQRTAVAGVRADPGATRTLELNAKQQTCSTSPITERRTQHDASHTALRRAHHALLQPNPRELRRNRRLERCLLIDGRASNPGVHGDA